MLGAEKMIFGRYIEVGAAPHAVVTAPANERERPAPVQAQSS